MGSSTYFKGGDYWGSWKEPDARGGGGTGTGMQGQAGEGQGTEGVAARGPQEMVRSRLRLGGS